MGYVVRMMSCHLGCLVRMMSCHLGCLVRMMLCHWEPADLRREEAKSESSEQVATAWSSLSSMLAYWTVALGVSSKSSFRKVATEFRLGEIVKRLGEFGLFNSYCSRLRDMIRRDSLQQNSSH